MYLAKNINPAEVLAAANEPKDNNRKFAFFIDDAGIYVEECLYSGTTGFHRRRISREKVFISLKELEKIVKNLRENGIKY